MHNKNIFFVNKAQRHRAKILNTFMSLWPLFNLYTFKRSAFVFFFCALSFPLQAQQLVKWEELADVKYSYEYSEAFKTWYSKPTFGESVKKIDGNEVVVKGYVLPMDVEGEYFILSQFPYSSCFFCGGAGQESVMELRFKKRKRNFKMDEFVAFKGTIKLNDMVFEMSYILEDAIMVDLSAGDK